MPRPALHIDLVLCKQPGALGVSRAKHRTSTGPASSTSTISSTSNSTITTTTLLPVASSPGHHVPADTDDDAPSLTRSESSDSSGGLSARTFQSVRSLDSSQPMAFHDDYARAVFDALVGDSTHHDGHSGHRPLPQTSPQTAIAAAMGGCPVFARHPALNMSKAQSGEVGSVVTSGGMAMKAGSSHRVELPPFHPHVEPGAGLVCPVAHAFGGGAPVSSDIPVAVGPETRVGTDSSLSMTDDGDQCRMDLESNGDIAVPNGVTDVGAGVKVHQTDGCATRINRCPFLQLHNHHELKLHDKWQHHIVTPISVESIEDSNDLVLEQLRHIWDQKLEKGVDSISLGLLVTSKQAVHSLEPFLTVQLKKNHHMGSSSATVFVVADTTRRALVDSAILNSQHVPELHPDTLTASDIINFRKSRDFIFELKFTFIDKNDKNGIEREVCLPLRILGEDSNAGNATRLAENVVIPTVLEDKSTPNTPNWWWSFLFLCGTKHKDILTRKLKELESQQSDSINSREDNHSLLLKNEVMITDGKRSKSPERIITQKTKSGLKFLTTVKEIIVYKTMPRDEYADEFCSLIDGIISGRCDDNPEVDDDSISVVNDMPSPSSSVHSSHNNHTLNVIMVLMFSPSAAESSMSTKFLDTLSKYGFENYKMIKPESIAVDPNATISEPPINHPLLLKKEIFDEDKKSSKTIIISILAIGPSTEKAIKKTDLPCSATALSPNVKSFADTTMDVISKVVDHF